MSKAKQIIIDGKVINLTPETDSYFDENSENPVQNKVLHRKFNEIEGNFDDVNDAIEDIVNGTAPEIINMLNPNDLLRGYTLATGAIVANSNGIFSNKLYLEIGKKYVLKNIPLFANNALGHVTTAIFIARYNSDDEFLDRDSVLATVLPSDGYATIEYTPTTTKSTNTTIANNTIAYYRILLQSGQNTKYPFDSTKAMIYDSKYKIDSFIPYGKTALFYDRVQDARINNVIDGTIPITAVKEAYLKWGGKVIKDGISPLDAAADSEFSANRLSFFDADDIYIEFSRDAGVNWFPYPTNISATDFKNKSTEEYYSEDGNLTYSIASPKDKQSLVTSGLAFQCYLGARNPYVLSDRLRITLNTEYNLDICCVIRKALFHVEGTNTQNCLIEGAKFGSPDSFTEIITTEIKGNDGWNSIPIGVDFGAWIDQTWKYKKIRITIIPKIENSTKFFINKIRFIGETLRFSRNGSLSTNNHMYTWDVDKNVTFPANVTSSNITKITNDISTLNAIISENGSDISKIKNKLFPLEVTLSVKTKDGGSTAVQEYTGANKEFIISWTTKIDGESVTPTALTLTVGGAVVTTDANKTSITVAANDDKEVKLYVEAEGRNATKTANINFARRYYSAVVDSTWTATNDTIKALEKSALKSAAAATVSYSAAFQKKVVFAYPVSHGVMSTIRDARQNDMFTLNDSGKTFNTAPTTVSVTLSGGATLDYYVYESVITNVVAGNITYTTKTFD